MGAGLSIIFVTVNLHLRYIYRNMQDLKFTEPSNVTGIIIGFFLLLILRM